MIRAYNEIVDFIASGTTPEGVANFCASDESKTRVAELIAREKAAELTPEKNSCGRNCVSIDDARIGTS
jgi:hypothetical protein